MKYSISNVMVAATMLLTFTISSAQIKNSVTENVKIYGNCGMCEKTIEKAGNLKNVATVDWNKDSKMASITYDSKKTTQDEVLKRIALAGYDSDTFLAPENVYNELPGCCQYDRESKIAVKATSSTMNHQNHTNHMDMTNTAMKEMNQLTSVLDNYFAVKDALVGTDGSMAAAKSKSLLTNLEAVQMDKLEMDVHMVWMKVSTNLKEDAKHIADTKDTEHQRERFINLSKNMYELIKVSNTENPIYYQFCPMANKGKGANWLSKENAVKNPYYGSMMMTCGKTVETIK
ncbi:DUF3347 domain-containing protein [Flavobacterium weaverense]|uniref:Copper chaperone CopZ n=1 Tax=Flavobacterium weaverense TaxID=271156 RepID=A0A3L9ZZ76_9FLAO|nr:DUF3347 domain-containing protein [Flavobacterium weaverense]RMA75828.1 copper chaperone CopZ [Flavobacterium weaverense]